MRHKRPCLPSAKPHLYAIICISVMPISTQPSTITDLLSHLVRMPTISSDRSTNRAALDWVQEQLRGLPLDFKTVTHAGVSNLIATTPAVLDPKKPKLWLCAHMDVVPGTPAEFIPTIKDGKLFGRGVFDMKYAIAIYIALLQELGADLRHYDLGLMIVGDEEVGGGGGAEHLTGLGYTGEAVLLPECGTSWNLETGAKAHSWWKVTSRGISGHAARPWQGLNAIDQLNRYLDHIHANFPSEPCGDEHHQHNTMNIGTISGGAATNQIPGLAEATIDVRLAPGTSTKQLQGYFEAATATLPSVTWNNLAADDGFTLRTDGPARLFEQIVLEMTGRRLGRSFAHASSDARFFADKGVHAITVPTTGGGQHSPEEWIDLADLAQYYSVVRRFTQEWAGLDSAP